MGQPPLHPRLDHPMREPIFTRQYPIREGETFAEGMRRVASTLYPDDMYAQAHIERVLLNGEGQFGGRVIAGAGTEHGNLLNCYVQAEPPGQEGTTDGVLTLAKKLALVTKVGGGNGVNLDTIPAKRRYHQTVGRAYLTIRPDHPDHDNVRAGRFTDLALGLQVERPYGRAAVVAGFRQPPHGLDGFLAGNAADDYYEHTTRQGGRVEHLVVPDSIEGIWDAAAEMVRLMLDEVDVIVDLSALRPEGDAVNGSGGTSSGPASFGVEIFNNFARWARLGGAEYAGPVATLRYVYAPTLASIKQGGVRRGAGMATLSVEHPDGEDFVTCKDLDREELEGAIGTFNISFLVTKDWLERGMAGSQHSTPESVELIKIAQHAHATGEPGLLFVDTINEHNMAHATQGAIKASNPCGEIGLYPGEPCDLGALNLAAFVGLDGDGKPFINYRRLGQVTRTMVRALDRVLDVEKAPLPEIAEAIRRNRRIGLGVMGLADMLVRMGVRYDSDEGRDLVTELIQYITEVAVNMSEQLGKELGVPQGVLEAGYDRRNIAVMTVAPTGTIAMMTGVSGGVEPIFSAVTYRRIGSDYHEIVHPLLVQILLDHAPEDAWDWDAIKRDISDANGSIRSFYDGLDDDSTLRNDRSLAAFVTAQEIAPADHVKMQAAVQRAFDYAYDGTQTFAGNSISKTINLPHEATVEDVIEAYLLASREGCKGITVYRDGSRQLQVLNTRKQEDGSEDEEEWESTMREAEFENAVEALAEEDLTGEAPDLTEMPYEELEREVAARFVDTTQLPGGRIFPPRTEAEAVAQIQELVDKHRGALDAIAVFDGPDEDDEDDELDLDGYNTLVQRDNPAPGFSYKYQVAGTKAYVQVFANRDGQLVEVFTPAPKAATSNERTAHAIVGRLISLALKYGVPSEAVEQSLTGHMDESGGISPEVGYVGSRWEVVAHALADARQRFEPSPEPALTVTPARQAVLSQAPCPDCGGELIREAGCLTCHRCGYSKCG